MVLAIAADAKSHLKENTPQLRSSLMERREVIRLLATAAVLPVFPQKLVTLCRGVHAQLAPSAALRTLNADQDAAVTAMAELIIPTTDTPGAKTARVNEFIDLMLAEWYPDGDRARFLAGLADVDVRSRAAYGKNFVNCDERDQVAILTALDAEVSRLRESEKPADLSSTTPAPRPSQKHFFHMMKQLTLIGYFTSEIGTPSEQRHQFLDLYRPCAPLHDQPKDS